MIERMMRTTQAWQYEASKMTENRGPARRKLIKNPMKIIVEMDGSEKNAKI